VSVNYQSHSGIFNVAAGILDRLFSIFPDSANQLKEGRGVFLGPRPGVSEKVEVSHLKELAKPSVDIMQPRLSFWLMDVGLTVSQLRSSEHRLAESCVGAVQCYRQSETKA
jgi:hypothetical protein